MDIVRNISLIAPFLASLLLLSCGGTVEERSLDVDIPVTFEAIGSTKVDIDGAGGAATWTAGDMIQMGVTDGISSWWEYASVDDGAVRLHLPPGHSRSGFALYPGSQSVAAGESCIVDYPAAYDLDGAGAAFSPCPMAAVNGDGDLSFYHVGGLLRLSLTGIPLSATKVAVTFTCDHDVAGTVTVADAGSADAAISSYGDGGRTVTFTKSSWALSQTLNIPLPCGIAVRGIAVAVYRGAYAVTTVTKSFRWDVERAHGLQMALNIDWVTITSGDAVLWTGQTARFETVAASPFVWESNDTSVATVDASTGIITAVAPGMASIGAVVDGAVKDRRNVYVNEITALTVSPAALSGAVGGEGTFTASAVFNGGGTVYGTPGEVMVGIATADAGIAVPAALSAASGVPVTVSYAGQGATTLTAFVAANAFGNAAALSATCNVTVSGQ